MESLSELPHTKYMVIPRLWRIRLISDFVQNVLFLVAYFISAPLMNTSILHQNVLFEESIVFQVAIVSGSDSDNSQDGDGYESPIPVVILHDAARDPVGLDVDQKHDGVVIQPDEDPRGQTHALFIAIELIRGRNAVTLLFLHSDNTMWEIVVRPGRIHVFYMSALFRRCSWLGTCRVWAPCTACCRWFR